MCHPCVHLAAGVSVLRPPVLHAVVEQRSVNARLHIRPKLLLLDLRVLCHPCVHLAAGVSRRSDLLHSGGGDLVGTRADLLDQYFTLREARRQAVRPRVSAAPSARAQQSGASSQTRARKFRHRCLLGLPIDGRALLLVARALTEKSCQR